MILRYFVLFGGIVLMVTGCNSLISQNFGTHRLRTVPLATAVTEGVGDADFLELTEAQIGEAFLVGPALRGSDKDYVLHPLLTKEQTARWSEGAIVTAHFVGWLATNDPTCLQAPGCLERGDVPVRGLVSEPTSRKNPVEKWAEQRIELVEEVVYLQLYEQPMAWYWNLALFVGGLLLAILPEARRHQRQLIKVVG